MGDTLRRPRLKEVTTDGHGQLADGPRLGQYDVILAARDMPPAGLSAGDAPLHYLSFYLPPFLPRD